MNSFPKAKRIVYSTCSLFPEENERVITNVVKTSRAKWRVQDVKELLKGKWNNFGSAMYGSMGTRCLYAKPESDLTTGFFLAVLDRDEKDLEKSQKNESVANGISKNESPFNDATDKKSKKNKYKAARDESFVEETEEIVKKKKKKNEKVDEKEIVFENQIEELVVKKKKKKHKNKETEENITDETIDTNPGNREEKSKKKKKRKMDLENESEVIESTKAIEIKSVKKTKKNKSPDQERNEDSAIENISQDVENSHVELPKKKKKKKGLEN